ncbi:zinc finger protein [Gigaspora margarita]|uniref:Zinc finger protein n=1 Tax=Gigaspora margarita TaxID=4874 RepID=A0A8H4EUH8_GIGMA|nr:zinc finger protein [Gigaspora margarita]
MSLLQYGFEQKRVRDDSLQNDQNSNNEDNEDNPNKNIKKSCTNNNKTFKLKWLTEFSWLHYNEDQKKMYCTLCMRHKKKNKFATEGATNISRKSAIREHTNTKDHNDAEKLEISRIQMESLQKEFTSSDVNTKHIIGVMHAVYFLAKKNLPLKLLPTIVKLLKELGLLDLFSESITKVLVDIFEKKDFI